MALVKITFDGSSVSSKQDADINFHLGGLIPAGIIRGLGGELRYFVSNNYITFDDGYVQIYGRRIYCEPETKVYVPLDSIKYGYVLITVDLNNNTVAIGILESESNYPSLIQENLLTGGKIYQFPICRYTKNNTSLNIDLSFTPVFIETSLSVAEKSYNDAINYFNQNKSFYSIKGNKSSGDYIFHLSNSQANNKNSTMFFAKISTGHIIAFPGNMFNGSSNYTVSYCNGGTNYNVIVGYDTSNSDIILTCSNQNDSVNYIYGVRWYGFNKKIFFN